MPAGSLVVQSEQLEIYRSDTDRLLVGANTLYHLMWLRGLDPPPTRFANFERQSDHGDFMGVQELLEKRAPRARVIVQGSTLGDLANKMDALSQAMRPSNVDIVLTFQIGGRSKQRMLGRPRRANWAEEADRALGWQDAYLEFACGDPLIYDHDLQSEAITIAGGSSSQSETITNFGTFGSKPTLSITGPATNPRIANAGDGNKSIKLDVVLSGTDTVVIDTYRKTVKLNGIDRFDLVRADNQWWEVLPGAQSVTYNRTGSTGSSTCTVSFRNAWNGV